MNNMNETYDFIIIGGGIAGLYCAMNLSNTHKVLLLEANDRLGGRIHTHQNPQYEIGAGRLHASHRHLLSLLKRFHLNTYPLARRMDHINQTDGYVPHVDRYTEEMIGRVTKTLNEELRHKTFEEHALSILGKEDTARLREVRGYCGDFQMNAYDAVMMFRREKKGKFMVVKEGLSELIRRMANTTKAKVQLHHTVKHISYDGVYHVDRYKANKLIVALPAQAIQSIPFFHEPLFRTRVP